MDGYISRVNPDVYDDFTVSRYDFLLGVLHSTHGLAGLDFFLLCLFLVRFHGEYVFVCDWNYSQEQKRHVCKRGLSTKEPKKRDMHTIETCCAPRFSFFLLLYDFSARTSINPTHFRRASLPTLACCIVSLRLAWLCVVKQVASLHTLGVLRTHSRHALTHQQLMCVSASHTYTHVRSLSLVLFF